MLQHSFFSAGSCMANCCIEKQTEILKKAIHVLVEFVDRRGKKRKGEREKGRKRERMRG